MQEDLQIRRKRLRFRAHHRGTKELDIYIGGFADANLENFDAAQLDLFEEILETDEVTLFAWIAGRQEIPANMESPVMTLFMAYQPPAGAN